MSVSRFQAPAGLSRRGFLTGLAGASALAAAGPLLGPVEAASAAVARAVSVNAASPPSNVKALQHLLTAYGIPTDPDGAYGPATRASVTTFQRRRALAADGDAGPKTMAALTGGSNVAVRSGWPNASTARAAQQLLVKLGASVPVDGSFTAQDAAVVTTLQKRWAINATGVVDAVTWSYLFDPPGTGLRKGPAVVVSQSGTDLLTWRHDCGPSALVAVQLRLGRTPGRWTDVAHRAPAIDYCRRTVLGMHIDDQGTRQIGDAGVLAAWRRLAIPNAALGGVRDATAALRAGGVAMVGGELKVSNTWQGRAAGSGGWHWIALLDHDASAGTYQVADSASQFNRLVWVTESQLLQYGTGWGASIHAR